VVITTSTTNAIHNFDFITSSFIQWGADQHPLRANPRHNVSHIKPRLSPKCDCRDCTWLA
jgi:hypothetical protein